MIRAAKEIIIDSFAGGGGASLGIAWATGRAPDIAINHDAEALAMHAANHPSTRHVREDVWHADLRKLVGRNRVGILWASPDCKHFSRAKGGKPVSKNIRSLAWVVCKWAQQIQPRIIFLENVREFADWSPLVPAWICPSCEWRGTEGQATLVRVRRKCPRCDCRTLKVTVDMIPDPSRKGLIFRRFTGRLRNLGYAVQFKNLNAADFGAPTNRRRLFLVARRDGEPIEWPEPSHGDPKKIDQQPLFTRLKPWRTAAECIDWDLPCPSIFDRDRELAPKTMDRIARGLKRYVLENPSPFLVPMTHTGDRRNHSIDEPLPTVTSAHRGEIALCSPVLVGAGGPGYAGKPRSVADPLNVVQTDNHQSLIMPTLVTVGYGERDGQAPRAPGLNKPLGTAVAGGQKHGLVSAMVTQLAHGGGQGTFGDSRSKSPNEPLGTVHSGGNNHALVAAWLVKHFGGVVGIGVDTPQPTTTARATQNQLACAYLARFNHGEKQWSGMDEPLGVVTSQGNKFGLVFAFLVKYFGTAIGQGLLEPLHTATGKARFALVTVQVTPESFEPAVAIEIAGHGIYIIADIGMRMLTPRELARAQGFPDTYILTGTKTSQVAKIGNSVCPPIVKAIVEANCPELCRNAAGVA